jgi:hypothetical protein
MIPPTFEVCPSCERPHTLDAGLEPGTVRCPQCLQDVRDLLDPDLHLDGCGVPRRLKKMGWSP